MDHFVSVVISGDESWKLPGSSGVCRGEAAHSCSVATDAGRILIREEFPQPMITESMRDVMSLNLFPKQTNTSITFPLSHKVEY